MTKEQILKLKDWSDDERQIIEDQFTYAERFNNSPKIAQFKNKADVIKFVADKYNQKQSNDKVRISDVTRLVSSMMKGTVKQRALVTPKELLPMIQDIKTKLEAEKKIGSLEKVIEKKGISNEDLLKYALSQMSKEERDEVIASL